MFSCSLQVYDKSKKTNKMTSAAEVEYLEKNSPNPVYLITYNQLDIRNSPTTHYFGAACALAFGGNKVFYFAAVREKHASSGLTLPCIYSPKKPSELAISKKNYLRHLRYSELCKILIRWDVCCCL